MPGVRRPATAPLVAALTVLLSVGLLVAATGSVDPAAVAQGTDPGATPPLTGSSAPSAPPASAAPATAPSPTLAPSSPPADAPASEIAIVPVANFRSAADGTTTAEVRAVLAGTSKRYEALELVAGEADAILAALGLERPADPVRLIEASDAAVLAADLAEHARRLAFLRADALGPSVRALAWEGVDLFGVDRVRSLRDWPLRASLPATLAGADPFDPASTWTIVAGGDILLDRGVSRAVAANDVDFPFDGGTADITSRYCCSSFGWELPRARRTGDAGAVRHLLEAADLALANFENPAPDRFRFHAHGTVFSANPALIAGLASAGIDYVSLGNNHIRDAGGAGVIQTRRNLARFGIAFSGAGKDLAEAKAPALLEAGGLTVAILGYDTIAKYYAAGDDRAGNAQLSAAVAKADIAAARTAGADVVIVYPHWGVEYRSRPTDAQRRLAHAIVDAGADLVIGNHAHWAGAMEVYRGVPVWYALGNFVFDQTWSEPTMEGIVLELTFRGTGLVQVRMHPYLILDRAQPNLLDPAGDGKVVLGRVFGASKGLLDW
jgi:poly-gamma-glutamate synthesis protein (capsule biosynthesis protein)